MLIVAVAYANTVFTAEEEKSCMGIGRVVGMMITDFAKAVHADVGAGKTIGQSVVGNAVSYGASAFFVGWFTSVLNCL